MTKPEPRTAKDLMIEDIENLSLHPTLETHATVRPTETQKKEKEHWKRCRNQPGCNLAGDFQDVKGSTLNVQEALTEARRCLKCADAPCRKGCPTSIDIKSFIQCISTQNYYGAAKMILSENPLGLSCGMICPVEKLCAGGCNLSLTSGGPINISGLQGFATSTFSKMRIPQIRPPELPPPESMPKSYDAKIAVIGCGPAGVSCATFLGRLGYTNIDVFEKNLFPGGLSNSEIPQYRLYGEDVMWEVELMKDLGIKVHFNQALGRDFTIQKLRDDGYAAVFFGIGLPAPNKIPQFDGLTAEQGFYTSKSFLPLVTAASKEGVLPERGELPKLHGKVLVLGAGDTAIDCAGSAFRCGASRVLITFRRSVPEMRAIDEEFEIARADAAEFLPYCSPKKVLLNNEGRIVGIELNKMEKIDGRWVIDEDQTLRVKCDFIISAFGSQAEDALIPAAAPLKFTKGIADVNHETMQSPDTPWLFAGGDAAGSGLTVEAANDGKTASWHIHKYLQSTLESMDVGAVPRLPQFYTEIDKVDLTTEFCGMKFINPFGIASASGATTAAMIARGFKAGWGFSITKTFSLDKDAITNVSPRIVKGTTSGNTLGPHQSSFLNIELISDKSAGYWCSGIRQLKKDFPKHIIVASIMASYNEADWKELTQLAQDAGPDALELNLSCPHGMGEKGMGLACGQDAELVLNICKWVKSVARIPVFAKLTPNITEVAVIAKAAKEGGADGVTAVNTVSGLMALNSKGEPWPAVGPQKLTTFGGMSGSAVRPIALRDIASIARHVPGFPIMGTGGADSYETSLNMLQCGAGVVQICSAVQNQDYYVVQDYIMGLKAHLYMRSRSDLKEWIAQQPPVAPPPENAPAGIPRFGPYQQQRWESEKAKRGPVQVLTSPHSKFTGKIVRTAVPSVNDMVGESVPHITSYGKLSQKDHVVAIIDDDLCINCGRCYMVCNDSGYQAIEFDAKTHRAFVTDNCTGCTLCWDVCPVANCVSMIPRKTPFPLSRGLAHGVPSLPPG